jgi:hypothetical protein
MANHTAVGLECQRLSLATTKPCHCCGRVLKRDIRKKTGRAMYRHKCQHGEWCVAGNGLVNVHANTPRCQECRKARHAEDLAAIRAAERTTEITPGIAAALEGERNRPLVRPKMLAKRP